MTNGAFPSSTAPKRIEVTITQLEQSARPALPPPVRPPQTSAILRLEHPPVHFYRYLYALVGEPHKWMSRRGLDDEALRSIIQHEAVSIYVLYIGGAPGGFAEVDARDRKTHELRFFGLAPDYVSKGWGRYFLTHILDLAWNGGAEILRVETCTLDHPSALPLYQKLGFEVVARRKGVVTIDRDTKQEAAE
ncbi:MAG: GNAT family N-acetyltransferase [Pseudomonadota bacterium]